MARYTRALKKIARQIPRRTTPDVTVKGWLGTVATVTAGASTDGIAAVTVTVHGATFPAPYVNTGWTPTNGDQVFVLFLNGSPLILGRVGGFPSF